MPLSPVARRELIARLRRMGFTGPFAGGRHEYMEREKLQIRLPNPHGNDIGVPLLKEILRTAGIADEDWLGA